MRDLMQATIAIVIVCALLFLTSSQMQSSGNKGSKDSITVYNWGEYIDPDLIDRFEKETGIKVVYETFDSNEAMMTKVQQGGSAYDVAMPSEYAIEKMKEDGLLIPLDKSKLPNLKNIDPYFLDLPFVTISPLI